LARHRFATSLRLQRNKMPFRQTEACRSSLSLRRNYEVSQRAGAPSI
jgi:hypothetical protein